MHPMPLNCQFLPIEIKNAIAIELGETFTTNQIIDLFEMARKEKAVSIETEGKNPGEYFWIIYPNKPLQATRVSKTKLSQDLLIASWND